VLEGAMNLLRWIVLTAALVALQMLVQGDLTSQLDRETFVLLATHL
jgi:hypothetical protein